ncbi:MAG: hypothetical protein JWL75_453 [Parcubacteria group bacterium]|nr:hypothetical protein [Parcubacteria group bacterium]
MERRPVMRLVYAHESVEGAPRRSLFLGGPSPREAAHLDWRKNARVLLHQLGFEGYVYIPLPRDGIYHDDFDHTAQIDWELAHLDKAGVRVFWIPRDLLTCQDSLRMSNLAVTAAHRPVFSGIHSALRKCCISIIWPMWTEYLFSIR